MYFQVFDRTVKQLVKGMGPDEVAAAEPGKGIRAAVGRLTRIRGGFIQEPVGTLRTGRLSRFCPTETTETCLTNFRMI